MVDTSLRARRRRETEREIASAALTLFEDKGVQATSIDEIVRAAGVSERTFFRYFERKENCVLVAHAELRDALRDEIDTVDWDVNAFSGIYAAYRRVLHDLESAGSGLLPILLRVDRLKRAEPGLLQAGLRVDAEQSIWLAELLVRHGTGELEARLFADTVSLLFRQTLQHWADRGGAAGATLAASAAEVERVWAQMSGTPFISAGSGA